MRQISRIIITSLLFSSLLSLAQKHKKPITIIKVLTFNIYHGETMNHDFNLDVIAKVINDTDADFVALQEVDYKTNRAKKYDLVTELAQRTKMIGIFGKAMDYDDGEYGEGVLSKHTFLQTRNVALPYSTGNEPRAALEVQAIINQDTISFIATHLDHLNDETDRIKQATDLNKVFKSNKHPSILAGDLNATPESKTINILEKIWTPSYNKEEEYYTYPANKPSSKIDYIMFQPKEKWRVISTQIIADTIASDHCAYLVTLELQD